ncbi:hypothetical protein ABZP12_04597 (plasmid) [Xanthomonas euvesicatoria]
MIPADPSITHPAQTEGRQLAPHLPTVALTRWTAPPGQRRPLAAPVDKSGTSCNRQARPPMPHRSPDAWGWIHPSPTATGSAARWPWSMRGRPCGFVAAGRRPPMRPASQSAILHRRRWCAMVLHGVTFPCTCDCTRTKRHAEDATTMPKSDSTAAAAPVQTSTHDRFDVVSGVVSRNRRNFRHPSRAITRQVA